MNGRSRTTRVMVEYPEHLVGFPGDLLDFIYEDGFVEEWVSNGLSVERDLWMLEASICLRPDHGKVIKGTGGLRKLRWGLGNTGKSGGLRVIYLWIPEVFIVYMFMAYPKSVQDDISAVVRKALKEQAEGIRQRLISAYKEIGDEGKENNPV